MWRLILDLQAERLGGPRADLTNDQGDHVTCAATSVGLMGSIVAQGSYESRVSEAKEKGYRVEFRQ
jgi:hypothetical protein